MVKSQSTTGFRQTPTLYRGNKDKTPTRGRHNPSPFTYHQGSVASDDLVSTCLSPTVYLFFYRLSIYDPGNDEVFLLIIS